MLEPLIFLLVVLRVVLEKMSGGVLDNELTLMSFELAIGIIVFVINIYNNAYIYHYQ